MSVMPSPAHKQKIVREFFQKRAIELQTAVITLRTEVHSGTQSLFPCGGRDDLRPMNINRRGTRA